MPTWKSLNVPVKRASGATLEDFEGNEYIGAFAGISVTNVGHTNDAVSEAVYPEVGDARGLGLMQGLELVDPDATDPRNVAPAPDPDLASRVTDRLRDDGVVMGAGGFYMNVLRIQPPLTITGEQLETVVTKLRSALAAET